MTNAADKRDVTHSRSIFQEVHSEGSQRQPQTSLAGVPDGDLLLAMARKDAQSHAAWEEFYRRHVEYLYFVCRGAFSTALGSHSVEDLVQDVLIRAYERARTFVLDQTLDADRQRRAVRAWLGKISANMVHDSFRDEPMVTFVDDEVLEAHSYETSTTYEEGEPVEPDRVRILNEAMQTLTEREQQVLRATAFWYQPGASQQRLPNRAMADLATDLKTSSANVRQIRVRSIAKVRNYFRRHFDEHLRRL